MKDEGQRAKGEEIGNTKKFTFTFILSSWSFVLRSLYFVLSGRSTRKWRIE
jgi:hypothetical protein